MRDEGFNEFSIRFPKSWCATEVRRVSFDLRRIEVVLADQDAQPVSQPWLPVIRAVAGTLPRGVMVARRVRIGRQGPQLLDRTKTNAVGLAQGAVDGARYGDAHLRAVDQGRDIGWVSVPKPHEPLSPGLFVKGRLEHPPACLRVTKLAHLLHSYACTVPALG